MLMFLSLLISCGGEQDTDVSGISDAAAQLVDQVNQQIEQTTDEVNQAIDSIPDRDDLIPPPNTAPDPANELVLCPFPKLTGSAVVFNRYTPDVSVPVTNFKENLAFRFSNDFYLYFFAPIDADIIASSLAGGNAIITLGKNGKYGTTTLQYYAQGALPSKIVINNVVYDPRYFFRVTLAGDSLNDALLTSNGIDPQTGKTKDLADIKADKLVCEVSAATVAAGAKVIAARKLAADNLAAE
jgi:hypothetical protein